MRTPTNGQPPNGRGGRGKAKIVAVAAAPFAASEGDASGSRPSSRANGDLDVLQTRVDEAAREGQRVTGSDVANWLGVSHRTGRRRLAELLADRPELVQRITPP
jgi:hypothetical protein